MLAEAYGKYEVVEQIGSGGFAEVMLAVDPMLGRSVAIKVIHPHLTAESGLDRIDERFQHEAKTVAALRHPNIVQLYDFGLFDDELVMVMEYLPGGTLKQRLQPLHASGEPLPFEEVVRLVGLLGDALAYAHGQGVVHRDLKPSNILFTSRDEPVLADFGLAEMLGAGQPALQDSASGVLVGTPAYMSPEHIASKPVDARSDIYSLAIVIYEMLVGRLPFESESTISVLAQQIKQAPPPPREFNPQVPDAIQNVLLTALAKAPDERYASASEFLQAFQSALRPVQVGVAAAAPSEDVAPEAAAEPAPRHNLPVQPARFVGREAELEAIQQQLANADCRLLTLRGPGGFGKTRLAIQAASEQLDNFDHGVFFVSLAPLSSAEFLPSTIASAINFTFYGQDDPQTQLINYLRGKRMLLVMDNFEHIIAGADILRNILEQAPQVKILATSRERLNLQQEWVLEISGLALPTNGASEAVAESNAVQLFVARASQISPDFSLTEAERPHVVRICRLVGGAPLGIELAAAWVRMLSCQEIAQEIGENLDFLATTLHDVPERHRSLRAMFEYSWKLLSEPERDVFRKLSVFRGGFQAGAAREVTGGSLHSLAALMDKSLLRKDAAGRYEMLETVKQYAQEKLSEDDALTVEVHETHSAYYATFLRERYTALEGGGQKAALEEISAEIENVRAGWRWAIDHGNGDVIAQALDSLYRYYSIRGWLQEGEEACRSSVRALRKVMEGEPQADEVVEALLGKALARQGAFFYRLGLSDEASDCLEKAHAILDRAGAREDLAFVLNYQGAVAYLLGDYEAAQSLLQDSLRIYREYDNRLGVAIALHHLGLAAQRLREYDEARLLHEECLKLNQRLGDQFGVSISLDNLGIVARRLGEHDEAREFHQESLAIRQDLGDDWGIAASLDGLGQISFAIGDYAEARALLEQSLAIQREIGDRRRIANTLDHLGRVASALQEYLDAQLLHQESLTISHGIGYQPGIAAARRNLGRIAFAQGDFPTARKQLHEALLLATDLHEEALMLDVLVGMAALQAATGAGEQALELLAFALRYPATQSETQGEAERLFAELEGEFSAQQVAAARERAQGRELAEVVAVYHHG